MGPVRQWLLGVVLTAFAAALARQLAPGGREGAAVRLVGGLLLTLALLRPLAGADWSGLAVETGGFRLQAEEQARAYREMQLQEFSAVIAEKTEAYIWYKAYQLGLDVTAEVAVAAGESGIPLPESVTLAGPYSPALAAAIEEGVGIPVERQYWLEKSEWTRKESQRNGSP